ncbi:hypothetical protein ACSSS7_008013 [Eimeria intestinalis]
MAVAAAAAIATATAAATTPTEPAVGTPTAAAAPAAPAASGVKPQQLTCREHLQPMITRALNQEAKQRQQQHPHHQLHHQQQQEQQQEHQQQGNHRQQQQQQRQRQQRYRCSSAVADFPLSLVCRALFPLNPTLECRPRGGPGGLAFFYEPLRPLKPRSPH